MEWFFGVITWCTYHVQNISNKKEKFKNYFKEFGNPVLGSFATFWKGSVFVSNEMRSKKNYLFCSKSQEKPCEYSHTQKCNKKIETLLAIFKSVFKIIFFNSENFPILLPNLNQRNHDFYFQFIIVPVLSLSGPYPVTAIKAVKGHTRFHAALAGPILLRASLYLRYFYVIYVL